MRGALKKVLSCVVRLSTIETQRGVWRSNVMEVTIQRWAKASAELGHGRSLLARHFPLRQVVHVRSSIAQDYVRFPCFDGLLYSTSGDDFPSSLDVKDAVVFLLIVECLLEACWYALLSSLELSRLPEAFLERLLYLPGSIVRCDYGKGGGVWLEESCEGLEAEHAQVVFYLQHLSFCV